MNKGTPIAIRNGLKVYKPLKSKTPLRVYTPLRKINQKQIKRLMAWRELTSQRIGDVNFKCEWCGKFALRLDGHHKIKRRFRNDTYENCYVCDRLCRDFIETHNINVRIYPNKKAWLNRKVG